MVGRDVWFSYLPVRRLGRSPFVLDEISLALESWGYVAAWPRWMARMELSDAGMIEKTTLYSFAATTSLYAIGNGPQGTMTRRS